LITGNGFSIGEGGRRVLGYDYVFAEAK